MSADADAGQARRRVIAEAVVAEGAVRIEGLAERFEMQTGYCSRGVATALPARLSEANDSYRSAQQRVQKEALARAAMNQLGSVCGIHLLALGGEHRCWCTAFRWSTTGS